MKKLLLVVWGFGIYLLVDATAQSRHDGFVGPASVSHQIVDIAQPVSTVSPNRISSHFKPQGLNWQRKHYGTNRSRNGAFRIICGFSSMAQTDPILQDTASPFSHHMHSFFGSSVNVEVGTDRENLLAHARSNCAGGGINRSLYWMPTMLVVDEDPATAHTVVPEQQFTAYYKTEFGLYGPNSGVDVLPGKLPEGWFNLRMIAHKLSADELEKISETPYRDGRRVGPQWKCISVDNIVSVSFGAMPNCAPGSLNLQIWFPQCLNITKQPRGAAAEDPAHYTREGQERWLRYATKAAKTRDGCPADGDDWVRIPTQSYSIVWTVPPEGMAGWHLASDLDAYGKPKPIPRGATAHGDFMNGWDAQAPSGQEALWDNRSIAQSWYEDCYLALMSCTNQVKREANGQWRFLIGDTGLLFAGQ